MVLKKIETQDTEDKNIEVCQGSKLSPLCMKRRFSTTEGDSGAKLIKTGDKKRLDTNMCKKCSRKLKAFNTYQCRCGHNFCSSHRFDDQHDCDYDYKSAAREQLAKNNPKVTPKKLL